MGIFDKLKDVNEMRKQAKQLELALAKETITGGNWIMPMDRVTDATTRSMTRNGRNSKAPIWNPVLSSDSM